MNLRVVSEGLELFQDVFAIEARLLEIARELRGRRTPRIVRSPCLRLWTSR
jgi:hypothetical protein